MATKVTYERLDQIRREAPRRAFSLGAREALLKLMGEEGWNSANEIAGYLRAKRGTRKNLAPMVRRILNGDAGNTGSSVVYRILEDAGADTYLPCAPQWAELVCLRMESGEMWRERGVRGRRLDDRALQVVLSLENQFDAAEADLVNADSWTAWRHTNFDRARDLLGRASSWPGYHVEDFLVTLGDWKFVNQFLPLRLAARHCGAAIRLYAQGAARRAEEMCLQVRRLYDATSVPSARQPDQAEHLRAIAYVFRRQGRAHAAEAAYQESLGIELKLLDTCRGHPDRYSALGQTRHGLARLYQELGMLDDALPLLELAAADQQLALGGEPGNADYLLSLSRIYWVRALALRQSGRAEAAEADYYRALEIRVRLVEDYPENPESLNELVWLFATLPDARPGDAERAVEYAEAAVRLAPENGGYLNSLGVAYYRAERFPEALRALEAACLHHGGGNAIDYLFSAMTCRQLGHRDEARRCYWNAGRFIRRRHLRDEEVLRFLAEAEHLLN